MKYVTVLFEFFRGQGKTPEIPDGIGASGEGEDDDDEDETDNEDEKDNKTDVEEMKTDDEQKTDEGKQMDPKSANIISECKLKSAQHVERNRKDIVEAGRKVKTLREIKAKKQETKRKHYIL